MISSTGYELYTKSKKKAKDQENGYDNPGFTNGFDGGIKLESVDGNPENYHANGKISVIENGAASTVIVDQKSQQTTSGKQEKGFLGLFKLVLIYVNILNSRNIKKEKIARTGKRSKRYETHLSQICFVFVFFSDPNHESFVSEYGKSATITPIYLLFILCHLDYLLKRYNCADKTHSFFCRDKGGNPADVLCRVKCFKTCKYDVNAKGNGELEWNEGDQYSLGYIRAYICLLSELCK